MLTCHMSCSRTFIASTPARRDDSADGAWRSRLRESWRSLRLGVIFFLAAPPTSSCNTQLRLAAFLGSVDYRGLKLILSPFRMNTYKVSEVLIMEDLCRT